MDVFFYFLFGFTVALIGVIPPGLLNLTAAKITVQENRRNAFLFSLGVVLVVGVQTYLSLLFARYLDLRPELIKLLQNVALGIFICISIYFLCIAKDTRLIKEQEVYKSKKSRFFLGIFLSAINLFPLPYWVYMSITFSSFGWFNFTKTFITMCVIGSIIGTLLMLILYAQFFNYAKAKHKEFPVNMNYIVGGITGVISVLTIIKILNDL
ncbi:MAG: lysine transporter LysE [Bacteroidetes bacterium HGW-Bacteroidetes-2]|jgi:threonine/homoserine/homoserine lactone efflux protein|nr:MAG: lysine transporter LysE [Bacteroidetes bacterium HGW-Bacteroidetes-2]